MASIDTKTGITSTLIFSSNHTDDGHDDPHCSAILSIPVADIDTYLKEIPELKEIWNAMAPRDQRACRKSGVLNISADYGYVEETQDGVGSIALDYRVEADKLGQEKGTQIRSWLTERYGIAANTMTSDTALQQVLDDPVLKEHITTDMTVSAMRRDMFIQNWKDFKAGKEEMSYPLDRADMERIVQSMEGRYGKLESDEALASCYNETVKMRDRWPNALMQGGKGFEGPEVDGSTAAVPFYVGAVGYKSEFFIGAGPYATTPPWAQSKGRHEFDSYDENGIARTEKGKRIAAGRLEPLDGYNYVSEGKAITTPLSVDDLKAAFKQMRQMQEDTVPYNGYTTNCMKIGMLTTMGSENMKEFEKAAFMWAREHPDQSYGKNFLQKSEFNDLSTEVQWNILRDATAAAAGGELVGGDRPILATETKIQPTADDPQGLSQTVKDSREKLLGYQDTGQRRSFKETLKDTAHNVLNTVRSVRGR